MSAQTIYTYKQHHTRSESTNIKPWILPHRYGCMAAQMKAFFDSTGLLWKEQKLAGKPAGFFVSTGSQGGGQETTA